MNNLSQYIIEKLHLNKDTKVSEELVHEGDMVLTIIHDSDYHRPFEISLSYYIVKDCNSNELKCTSNKDSWFYEFKLNSTYNKPINNVSDLDKVFAYKKGEAKKSGFEYILLKSEAIGFLKEVVNSYDKNIIVPGLNTKYENVIYFKDWQYQAKDLLKIFESN